MSYSVIINYFGETKIIDRYKYLYEKMQEYIRARELEGKLFVQEAILHQVVMDYFVDIYRLKEFHKIDKADISKILSYEAYWILRRKPLQATQLADNSKLIFANEGFVTTFLAHEFLMPLESEPLSKEVEESFLEYLQHFNYHLKYRNIDKQDLEAMLYSYQTGRQMK